MSETLYDIKHLFLSHSSGRLLESCARKLEFRKMYAHPGKDRSVPADMGTALHRGVQTYLITKDQDKAIIEYMLSYPIDLCQSLMDKYSLEAGYNTLMAIMNEQSLVEYELIKVNCLDGVIRPAVEVPFQIDFTDYLLSN